MSGPNAWAAASAGWASASLVHSVIPPTIGADDVAVVVLDVVVVDVAVLEVAVLEVAMAVVAEVLDVAALDVAGATDVVEPACALTELDVGVVLVGAAVSLSAEQADSPAAARIAIPRVTLTWEFMVGEPTGGRPAVLVPPRHGGRSLRSLGWPTAMASTCSPTIRINPVSRARWSAPPTSGWSSRIRCRATSVP